MTHPETTTGSARDRLPPPDGYFGSDRPDVRALVPAEVTGVLDVGCGEGAFLGALATDRPGLRTIGIEADPGAGQRGRDRGVDIRTGLFPDALDGFDAAVDCITFNDVLEHLEDPWVALERARALVGPGRWLVTSIPNLRNLDNLQELVVRGDFRYRPSGVLDVTHLRFFTRRSAERLLSETGWTVQSATPALPIKSRKLKAIGRVGGIVAPWLRREGIHRQIIFVARAA